MIPFRHLAMVLKSRFIQSKGDSAHLDKNILNFGRRWELVKMGNVHCQRHDLTQEAFKNKMAKQDLLPVSLLSAISLTLQKMYCVGFLGTFHNANTLHLCYRL